MEMKFGGWELICSVVRNVIEIGLIHWKKCTENEGSAFGLSPKVWTESWLLLQRSCILMPWVRSVGKCGCYQTSDIL